MSFAIFYTNTLTHTHANTHKRMYAYKNHNARKSFILNIYKKILV
jgi:hypothetical protein